ncbi:Molybdopterin binding protein [Suhomyces tanzawaensis NRRL Y-17324]|uniref:Molybdopterin binding protein n=1 Tax=Suhomyces tanzawaensis NRRL Y-17324 TaxID=984487 RepID=A0A1E4SCW2_9ASCO|nr:Molybdopterin binding protein [Suhomyces tanzawaensis NRRL Y-17324]ODV77333.1 Molybdopterin binding protein [Suhomyces tanzawaensis NRRL Y-17324]
MSSSLKPIRSAGCLIIGDEVLNGKILDTNSYNFARFCFNNLSIPLKRTIVCGDDKQDIINSLKILRDHDKVDLIVTSGGLGSTHDDITYAVLSEIYGLDYKLDSEVVERMTKLRGSYLESLPQEQLDAFYKMATLPSSTPQNPTTVEKIFVEDSLWFPIVALDQQVYVLPGVPNLFTKLIQGMEPFLKLRIDSDGSNLVRLYVKTSSSENEFAGFLTRLQDEVDTAYGKGTVKLGSYPHINWKLNTLSIIGKVPEVPRSALDQLVDRILRNVGGNPTQIDQVEEDKLTNEDPPK